MTSEWMLYARAIFALMFVVGLIFFSAFVARKAGLDKRFAGMKGMARQLEVIESLYLDQKHRLVIVRLGDNEHLLLLSASGDVVVESRKWKAPNEV